MASALWLLMASEVGEVSNNSATTHRPLPWVSSGIYNPQQDVASEAFVLHRSKSADSDLSTAYICLCRAPTLFEKRTNCLTSLGISNAPCSRCHFQLEASAKAQAHEKMRVEDAHISWHKRAGH